MLKVSSEVALTGNNNRNILKYLKRNLTQMLCVCLAGFPVFAEIHFPLALESIFIIISIIVLHPTLI